MSDETWGPLAEPIHPGAAGPDDLPWRENAFFSFGDPAQRAGGVIHVSTSLNAEGRRARASVAAGGRTAELVEPLTPESLSSSSIHIDFSGRVRVDSPGLSVDLSYSPRFTMADYTLLDGFLAPLGDAPPIKHYQQGADVTGWVEIDGDRVEVSGQGFRDRTWGFRDDQRAGTNPDDRRMTIEYIAGGSCLQKCDVTLMKMLNGEGGTTTGGFVLTDIVRRVVGCEITRDSAGLLDLLEVEAEDGERLALRVVPPRVGFWLPLGVPRKGAMLSVYDEVVELDGGPHGRGGGVIEHGVLRRLT